jgi:hypothetical protein
MMAFFAGSVMPRPPTSLTASPVLSSDWTTGGGFEDQNRFRFPQRESLRHAIRMGVWRPELAAVVLWAWLARYPDQQ